MEKHSDVRQQLPEAIGMHRMTEAGQKKVLRQLVKQANEESRKQALSDPLSRIARA